jgi:hypothetical protein
MKHRCFEVQTPAGLAVIIRGNPKMSAKTRKALCEMVAAAMRMVESSTLKPKVKHRRAA